MKVICLHLTGFFGLIYGVDRNVLLALHNFAGLFRKTHLHIRNFYRAMLIWSYYVSRKGLGICVNRLQTSRATSQLISDKC